MFRIAKPSIIQRALLSAGIVLGLLAAGAPASEAALDGCRSDPVIYLSDGSAIDLSASIGTSVSNVKAIAYTVHVPAGLKMILYAATPTIGFQGKESFALINDAPAGHYSTDTLVRTSNGGVSVTSQTTLVGLYVLSVQVSLQSKPTTGPAGTHLWTTVTR